MYNVSYFLNREYGCVFLHGLQLANREKIEKLEISVTGAICHDLGAIRFYYNFDFFANVIL